jgi:hypothetical protein
MELKAKNPWLPPRACAGAGVREARDERMTKDLRKQIEQARPIPLHRFG